MRSLRGRSIRPSLMSGARPLLTLILTGFYVSIGPGAAVAGTFTEAAVGFPSFGYREPT